MEYVCVWIYKNICMYLKFVRIGWDMPAVIHFTCEYDDLMNNALLLFFFNIGITYLLYTMDRDDNSIISLRYPYEQKHILLQYQKKGIDDDLNTFIANLML